MFQYRNSAVQKRTGSAAASLMAAISSGRKMVQAETLEKQNENRLTDELQENTSSWKFRQQTGRSRVRTAENAPFLASA